MSDKHGSVRDEFRQAWRAVLIVAIVSCLLGATTGFGYLQLRFVGVTGSPTETVQRYLQAIAQNDSLRALQEVADKPSDQSMLTDEVLRAAHLDHPMTDIAVDDTNSPRVPVTFTLGDVEVSSVITVKAVGGVFRIDRGFVTADISSVRNLGVDISVGGRETTTDTVTVFPAVYPLATVDSRLQLDPGGTIAAASVGEAATVQSQDLELSGSGEKTLDSIAGSQLTDCAATGGDDCPLEPPASGTFTHETWTVLAPPTATLSSVENGTATVLVESWMRFTGTTEEGEKVNSETTISVKGTVDLGKEDWQIDW